MGGKENSSYAERVDAFCDSFEQGKERIFNENLHNTAPCKAVPCDIVKEIFKARDALLHSSEDAADDYEFYKKSFDEYEEKGSSAPNYVLGGCYEFLKDYSELTEWIDVEVYSTGYYLADEGKYQGICKLLNGADVVVFHVACEEQPSELYQVLYFDGSELRVFTPFSGNAVNVVTMTALGDEGYTKFDKLAGDLYSKVYPDGLPDVNDYEFAEATKLGYLSFLGYTEDDFESGLFPDKALVDKEIEMVLS